MARKLVLLAGSAGTTLWRRVTTTAGGGTTYWVSLEGNVYSIASPSGYEHVKHGPIATEGYVLCYPA